MNGDAGRGGNELGLVRANNLANVEVGATLVDLGVVLEEDGGAEPVLLLDLGAGVAGADDVGSLAILALGTEAEGAADFEVGAALVDDDRVDGGELPAGGV